VATGDTEKNRLSNIGEAYAGDINSNEPKKTHGESIRGASKDGLSGGHLQENLIYYDKK